MVSFPETQIDPGSQQHCIFYIMDKAEFDYVILQIMHEISLSLEMPKIAENPLERFFNYHSPYSLWGRFQSMFQIP